VTETIFVTTTAFKTPQKPWATENCRRMVAAASAYRGGDFRLTLDPAEAKYLLFVDSADHFLGDVLRSATYAANRERSFVFNHNDDAFPAIPGIYPDFSAPVRRPGLQLGGFYLRCFENALLIGRSESWSPRFLFSFVGNVRNAPVLRQEILGLDSSDSLLLDRSSGLRDDDARYVEILRDSQFVICPKGIGPTSWRIYETMMASRVPVVVSDGWVPAREIDWSSFSLRVAEGEVELIPALCRENAGRAREMGRRARDQWEEHCSKENAFGWVGRRLQELQQATGGHGRAESIERVKELLFRRALMKYIKQQLGRSVRSVR
jgi:hypothetical protein